MVVQKQKNLLNQKKKNLKINQTKKLKTRKTNCVNLIFSIFQLSNFAYLIWQNA